MRLNTKAVRRLKARYGDQVLITGATSGIGKEMTFLFGAAGFNLILTGRRKEALTKIATELTDLHKVKVIPIAAGLLVSSDLENELNMRDLNCRSVLILSHFFANSMATRGKGAIILLSSIVAFQGVPNAGHYAATKAYVQSLGEALSYELKPLGIDVLNAAPGPVETGFAKRAKMTMGKALKPNDVAATIIKSIGRRTTVFPGLQTKIIRFGLSTVPRWLKIRIMGSVMEGFTKSN